jgi:hypothetical protein
MSGRRFRMHNGPMVTTAAPVLVTTGTAIKTMLQIKPLQPIRVIEWGFIFDVVPTAAIKVELVTTGAVAATGTAAVANDIYKYDDASNPVPNVTLTTTTTMYTATSEGSITATRMLDFRNAWEQSYNIQFPLEREPQVITTDYLRIRMTTATAINAYCYVTWEE